MGHLWSAAERSALRELCALKGATSAQIAVAMNEQFGSTITRQAVIGKARRMGLVMPRTKPARPPRVAVEGPPVPSRSKSAILYRPMPKEVAPPKRFNERLRLETEPALFDGIFLMNAREGDCRRPINDPPKGQMTELRICGQPVNRSLSRTHYCTACYHRLYHRAVRTGRRFVLTDRTKETVT